MDTRVPRDLGLYYGGVPHAFDLVMGRTPGGLGEWWRTIGVSTGWYHLLLGGFMAIFGRNQDTFQVPNVLWVAAMLALVGAIGRRLAGDRAALTAVALTAAMPGVFVAGRTGWLHVPEAVLSLAGLLAWMADPKLERRRTGLSIGLIGLLTFTMRPSGLVWVGTLGLLVAWSVLAARREGRPQPKLTLALLAAGWAGGSVVPLLYMKKYLSYKLDARDRYKATLPDIGLQAQMMLGAIQSWVIALGLVLGVVVLVRWWRAGRPSGPAPDARLGALLMLGVWVVTVFVLWLGFRAGIDNFTLLCPALALFGALGFEWLAFEWLAGERSAAERSGDDAAPSRGAVAMGLAGPALAFVGLVPTVLMQFTQPGGPDSPGRNWPGLREIPSSPHLLNWFRPFDRFGEPEMKALVDSTCGREAAPASCQVVVDQGLFCPFGEEPGYLELFLAGDPRVVIKTVRDAPLPETEKVDALIEFHCGERDVAWRERWPRSLQNLEALLKARVLEPVWTQEVGPGCDVLWYTTRGYLPHPDQLPAQGRRLLGGEPADFEALRKATEQSDPNPQLGGPSHDQGTMGRIPERPGERAGEKPGERPGERP